MADRVSWNYAFLFHGIAFGMLPTLVLLYFVGSLGGSLFDFGVMSASATIFSIGASIYAGQLPEKFGRAKPFILISFLLSSVILFALSRVNDILFFQVLYVLLEGANSIYVPSTRIFIAETLERVDWNWMLARHNLIIGFGETIGLALCSLFVSRVGYGALLSLCAPLVCISFIIACIVLKDPPFYVERWLSRISRPIDDVVSVSVRLDSIGRSRQFRFKPTINMIAFGVGTLIFAIASSSAFLSLPIFFKDILLMTPSVTFAVLMFRSLFRAFSYVIVGRWSSQWRDGDAVKVASFARGILVLLLPTLAVLSVFAPIVAVVLLSAVALSWALYSVDRSTIMLDYSPKGSLGVHGALRKLGNTVGVFLSGLIPTLFSFNALFTLASLLFIISFVVFWKSIS